MEKLTGAMETVVVSRQGSVVRVRGLTAVPVRAMALGPILGTGLVALHMERAMEMVEVLEVAQLQIGGGVTPCDARDDLAR